ncbi:MAG: hypothetical protein ACJA2G_003570 [Cognaticolwellia sp.]|jgi:hypothetical protein
MIYCDGCLCNFWLNGDMDVLVKWCFGLDPQQWLTLTTEFEKHFCYAAGAELMINTFKRHTDRQRLRGMGKAKVLLKRS